MTTESADYCILVNEWPWFTGAQNSIKDCHTYVSTNWGFTVIHTNCRVWLVEQYVNNC